MAHFIWVFAVPQLECFIFISRNRELLAATESLTMHECSLRVQDMQLIDKSWFVVHDIILNFYQKWYLKTEHDKTNKITCVPSEDSDQPGHPPSLIGLCCQLSFQQRLIRLSGCPGWPESLLIAQPFCWFCHAVPQLQWHWVAFSAVLSSHCLVYLFGNRYSWPSKNYLRILFFWEGKKTRV